VRLKSGSAGPARRETGGRLDENEVIELSKGERYSPRFHFRVGLEVLKGDREAVEIARAYNLHPTTVARWRKEFLENGAKVVGKDRPVAQYEKRSREMERLLGKKDVELALLQSFLNSSSCRERTSIS